MTKKRIKRRLTAILAADMVGYSRLMGEDEEGTLVAMTDRQTSVIGPQIKEYDGRIVKLMGDGTLAEFASVVDAVQCATEMQRELAARNAEDPKGCRIDYRIGIHLGDVIPEGDDIYGEGVNVAVRLEALAEPGGICISGAVYDAIGKKLPIHCEDMGEQHVKNIDKPVRVFRVFDQLTAPVAKLTNTSPRAQLAAPFRGKPSLAIKPFENLSAEPDQGQFADALSHGIIVALTRIPHFILVGDESPSLHRSKEMTVQELGRAFAVRYVLKGSLRKLGSKVRISAELVDLSTGQFLWAENFDRDLSDLSELFAIQDEITEKIVVALEVKLRAGDAGRLVRNAFHNPTALQSYYNGEFLLWNAKSNLELREAQHFIEEAIRLEPESSAAHATAALIHWVEVLSGWSASPTQSLARATEMAREAIRLNDVTGYPHLVLAQVHLSKREFEEANAEADLAVSARPSCPTAYSLKANVLIHLGRPSEAIEHAQYAARLSPVHPPMYLAILASAFYGSHRYEEAAAAAKAAIELDDRGIDPYLFLSAACITLGRVEEAQRAARHVLKLKPEFSLAEFAQAQPYKNPEDLDCLIDHLRSAGLS